MQGIVRITTALLTIVVLCTCQVECALASAADDVQSAKDLQAKGDYAAAIKLLSAITDADYARQALRLTAACHEGMGDLPKAIACYTSYLSNYPTPEKACSEVRSDLAAAYLRAGRFDEARDSYKVLLSTNPEGTASWKLGIGKSYMLQYNFKDAATVLREARAAVDRNNGVSLELANSIDGHLAESLYRAGDWEAAGELYQSLILSCPEAAAGCLARVGHCYEQRGMPDKAVEALRASLDQKPPLRPADARGVKFFLAQANLHRGHHEEALAWYQSVVDESPDGDEGAKLMVGVCHQRLGNNARAMEVFKDLQANGKSSSTQVLAALNTCDCIPADDAVVLLDKTLEEHPEWRADILLEKGESLAVAGKHAEAIPPLKQMISEFPTHRKFSEAVQLLCWSLEKCGRIDEAVEAIESSLPKDATPEQKITARHRIAGIYQNAKKHREAIKVFKEVRKSKDAPDEMRAEAAYQSGLCYKAIRYDNSARICMNEVVKEYPDSGWGRQARGQLYVWGLPKSNADTSGVGR